MQSRRASQAWSRNVVPEVALVVSRWTAAKAGTIGALWPTAPRWLGRYLDGMLTAHTHSVIAKE